MAAVSSMSVLCPKTMALILRRPLISLHAQRLRNDDDDDDDDDEMENT